MTQQMEWLPDRVGYISKAADLRVSGKRQIPRGIDRITHHVGGPFAIRFDEEIPGRVLQLVRFKERGHLVARSNGVVDIFGERQDN